MESFLFFLLSLGQLQRISFLNQRINVYLHEIFMLGLILKNLKTSLFVFKKWKEIFFFLLIIFLSLINRFFKFSLRENIIGFLYFLRLTLYFFYFFYLLTLQKIKRKMIIKKGFKFFGFLTLIFSFLQYFFYPDLGNLSYLGWDRHQFRVFSVFFDTHISGMIFLILFFYFFKKGKDLFEKSLAIGFLVLIFLTYSRLTYFLFLFLIIYLFLKEKNKPLFFVLFIVSVFSIFFLIPKFPGESTNLFRRFTIFSRMEDWKKGILIFKENPILGIGYNRIGAFKQDGENVNHSRAGFSSSYLIILVTSGIFGLMSFLFLLKRFFCEGKETSRLFLIGLSLSSFFENIFLVNFILFLFLTLLAYDVDKNYFSKN